MSTGESATTELSTWKVPFGAGYVCHWAPSQCARNGGGPPATQTSLGPIATTPLRNLKNPLGGAPGIRGDGIRRHFAPSQRMTRKPPRSAVPTAQTSVGLDADTSQYEAGGTGTGV